MIRTPDFTIEALEAAVNDWLASIGNQKPVTPGELRRVVRALERRGYSLSEVPFVPEHEWDRLLEEVLL